MAGNDFSQVRPKAEQDRNTIAAGSPLAIQGIFLEIIRERFAPDAGLDWTWDDRPTKTDILIEAGYNEETESRGQGPAIYVTRRNSRPRKTQVGDRAGVRLTDHLEGFSALMDVDLSIDCVSSDAGESAIISDIVQFMLIASEDVIQQYFGLYSMTHANMSQTVPYFNAPNTKFNTPLDFQVSFWVRWSQVPIAPLLQQIGTRVEYRGKDTFIRSVLNSVRRGSTED